MFKRNIILYLVFMANTVYSVMHGFTWLYWVTAALTATAFTLDVWEALHRGKS